MDTVFLGVIALVFLGVVLALEGAYEWWNNTRGPEARRIAKRIRMMSAGGRTDAESTLLIKERLLSESPTIQKLLLRLPRIATFDRYLVQSGTGWTVAGFAGITSVLVVLGVIVPLALHWVWPLALIVGLMLGLAPLQYLAQKRSRRTKRFEELMPEALDLIGRALRAGHSFSSALQMAGDEMPDPIGEELRQTFDEVNFGIAVPAAMGNLVSRVPSTDLSFFAIAVLIQRETGGNLSEVLGNISTIIRERLRLHGKVRALSAEGRLSAVLLSSLPFITAFLIWLLNPEMMSLLWTEELGRRMIAGAVVMMVIGMIWMRSIIRIHI